MSGQRRSIRLFYAVALLQGMVFYAPVATLYRQAAGMNLFQIGLIESIFLCVMLALEIPWGRWADRLGHRRTLILCSALLVFSKVIFWQARGFWDFLAERLVLSVASAGLSGCDSAYLFALCPDGGHRAAFSSWEGVTMLGMVSASLVWPLLGGNYRLAALLTVITYAAAALLALGYAQPEERPGRKREQPISLRAALRRTLALAPILLAFALLRETAQEVAIFLSQPLYVRSGIPLDALGLTAALVTVAGLVGGLSHRVEERLGRRKLGGALFLAAALGCLLPVLSRSPAAAVCAVVLCRGAVALMNPLSLSVQNEHSPRASAATQLSCNAMLMNLGAVALYPAFGALAERGLKQALLLGAVCCVLGLGLFLRGLPAKP